MAASSASVVVSFASQLILGVFFRGATYALRDHVRVSPGAPGRVCHPSFSYHHSDDNSSVSSDQHVAQFLAMNKTTGKLYDVKASQLLDFVCQYRAPAPCPDGFRYYVDSTLAEYGLSSCLLMFPADGYNNAAAQCGAYIDASPQNQLVTYNHLASFHNLTGATTTPLVAFHNTLATLNEVSIGTSAGDFAGVYWTGGLVLQGAVSWNDHRAFDSAVANPFGYTQAHINTADKYVSCCASRRCSATS